MLDYWSINRWQRLPSTDGCAIDIHVKRERDILFYIMPTVENAQFRAQCYAFHLSKKRNSQPGRV
jgi:hypothetical protein